MSAQPGHALRASAGPARAQARPAAPAGGQQAGQPGGRRQQLINAVVAGHRHHGPDPATGQGKPLPRPVRRGAAGRRTHYPIFPRPGLRAAPAAGFPAGRLIAAVRCPGPELSLVPDSLSLNWHPPQLCTESGTGGGGQSGFSRNGGAPLPCLYLRTAAGSAGDIGIPAICADNWRRSPTDSLSGRLLQVPAGLRPDSS
jgi:hypothetical protein